MQVIPLFLIADLVCATSVFPVFLGLLVDDLVVGPNTRLRVNTEEVVAEDDAQDASSSCPTPAAARPLAKWRRRRPHLAG